MSTLICHYNECKIAGKYLDCTILSYKRECHYNECHYNEVQLYIVKYIIKYDHFFLMMLLLDHILLSYISMIQSMKFKTSFIYYVYFRSCYAYKALEDDH